MAKVAIFLATGFEEIEAVTIIDILRRAEVEVDIIGVGNGAIKGGHLIAIQADLLDTEIKADDYDMLVLPGGLDGVNNLIASSLVKDLLLEANKINKKIAAICAAPLVLHKFGILKGNYTCYPSFEAKIDSSRYIKKDVVIDKNIITSKGPSSAMSFSLEIVKELKSNAITDSVKEALLLDK